MRTEIGGLRCRRAYSARYVRCTNVMWFDLVQCTLIAKRYSPYLQRFYERIKKKRRSGKAIIAAARKFLRNAPSSIPRRRGSTPPVYFQTPSPISGTITPLLPSGFSSM